ncbi:glycerophosphoryl diester phosphodiesterase [Sansalvadorimonas sp. 2012CJ34-2]|uniref:Glycerophosphoryl diester phosphodiesterase n=1 Tax=Parendozoicomonas callyspongiae TaxID=2942213 RepID=A0ABT0PAW4_9GAMM|nr:glycerophosphoryl diester phosphodiesterase [Sansalvadorimonas sp. 2012CJ34-2]MCL6268515.1 glycerophosphoryl diester phosphodiesterase [Sansalvadorimonas sp. 2012CJ34-2]
MRMSAVIGHRGAAQLAPENTLAGIRTAHALGLEWVEMDVVLLGDGQLVIHHDQAVNRCTNGSGELLSSTLEEIKALDAGVGFSKEFAGEEVPTLKEVIDLLSELGMGLNLEIKMHKHPVDKLVLPVVEALKQKSLPDGKLLVSSFDHDALKLFHEHMPAIPVAHLFEKLSVDWQEQARKVGAVAINLGQKPLKRSQVQEVINEGYEVYCYTVNSQSRADELWSWGVSGVFTDNPKLVIR